MLISSFSFQSTQITDQLLHRLSWILIWQLSSCYCYKHFWYCVVDLSKMEDFMFLTCRHATEHGVELKLIKRENPGSRDNQIMEVPYTYMILWLCGYWLKQILLPKLPTDADNLQSRILVVVYVHSCNFASLYLQEYQTWLFLIPAIPWFWTNLLQGQTWWCT